MTGSAASIVPDGCHRYECRVYYEDTDAGGIVYHANYLRFAERARTELLRSLGVSHAELSALHGLIFVVRRIKTDYVRPARLDESLSVLTTLASFGAASAELEQRVVGADGGLRVRLRVGLACVRMDNQRPARLPDRWRGALEFLARSGTRPGPTGGE